MTNEEVKGRLESFIDTFNICKEHDNALVAVSISKEDIQAFTQAIKALETVSCIKEKCAYCPHCENCDVDDETLEIKALEQQPCEDAVSRQAVHDLIAELLSDYLHDEDREKIEELDVKIEDLPPVTPKENSEYEHDHEVVKAYNDGQAFILDKIRTEINKLPDLNSDYPMDRTIHVSKWAVIDIIDKYRERANERL